MTPAQFHIWQMRQAQQEQDRMLDLQQLQQGGPLDRWIFDYAVAAPKQRRTGMKQSDIDKCNRAFTTYDPELRVYVAEDFGLYKFLSYFFIGVALVLSIVFWVL